MGEASVLIITFTDLEWNKMKGLLHDDLSEEVEVADSDV